MPAITGEPFTSDYDGYIEYGQTESANVAAAVRAGDFPDGLIHWPEYGQYEGRTAI